jgi:hypothetical protein
LDNRHTLTILLYSLSRQERFDLEDYLLPKFEEAGIGDWLGSGGLIDNSEQDIAYNVDEPKTAFRLVKEWLRAYGVPKDTILYIDSGEKFHVYEDD